MDSVLPFEEVDIKDTEDIRTKYLVNDSIKLETNQVFYGWTFELMINLNRKVNQLGIWCSFNKK